MNATAEALPRPAAGNERLQRMLHGPVAATLVGMAWPNTLMVLSQSATGLIETWFLARLGTDALAGVAVVVPMLILMQNMSQGAMGGGISAAVSRALGAGRGDEANALVLHALVLNLVIGCVAGVAVLLAGPWLYHRLGASGQAHAAALAYSDILFAGMPLVWAMNAFASVIRGTGNMMVPGAVICGGALCLVGLSPALIFGFGPVPPLGVAGGAWALIAYYAVGTLVLGWFCLGGRNPARLKRVPLRWAPMRDILKVGGLACLNPLMTNALVALTAALVGAHAGTAALAGYAVGARLEYLVIPIAFGLGAPMVALVGANLGAGQPERARRIAITGGAIAFGVAEVVGLAAAVWPEAWLRLFGAEASLLQTGATYLRIVGPCYGFFAMGFALYFASQGAGRLKWPLLAVALRFLVAVGGGALVLRAGGSLAAFFAVAAVGMVAYGALVLWSVARRPAA